ncbi:MAG: 3-oxoadipate enol-lactonase [Gammaproteobacteria bacterium]
MPQVEIDDLNLHYRLDGETGAVVLLSNSLASNLAMWDAQVPALRAAGFRVLRYDTRGHGQSSVPKGPYRLEQLADDARALIDRLGFERVHFCGLSLGGMIGQLFATRYPERLQSLTLCATAAYLGPPDLWAGRIKMVEDGGMQAVVDATISRWFTQANQARLPEAVARVRAGILATPTAGYIGCGAAIRGMDQRETIRTIRTPSLVMVGALDPSTTVEEARLLNERIIGSELVIIRDTQHFLNIEEPQEFNAASVDFLQRHR